MEEDEQARRGVVALSGRILTSSKGITYLHTLLPAYSTLTPSCICHVHLPQAEVLSGAYSHTRYFLYSLATPRPASAFCPQMLSFRALRLSPWAGLDLRWGASRLMLWIAPGALHPVRR